MMHVFKIAKSEPAYLFQSETNTVRGVEGEITRM